MNDDVLRKISDLIERKKINDAHLEITKLGTEYHKNSEYLLISFESGFLFKGGL